MSWLFQTTGNPFSKGYAPKRTTPSLAAFESRGRQAIGPWICRRCPFVTKAISQMKSSSQSLDMDDPGLPARPEKGSKEKGIDEPTRKVQPIFAESVIFHMSR
jgi:hypothetical protein